MALRKSAFGVTADMSVDAPLALMTQMYGPAVRSKKISTGWW